MRHVLLFLFALGLFGLVEAGRAGEDKKPAKAEPEFRPLWRGQPVGAKGKDQNVPGIYVHLPPADRANGAAVVICPGGGYGGLAISYEGHDVARWLNTLGVAGIVLKYRHAPDRHPIPLYDAQRALRYVRFYAKEWKVDPGRVGILGFSAGGHLASTAGTHFDTRDIEAQDAMDHLSARPDFMVLVYPVITLSDPYTHQGSRRNLLGDQPDPKLVEDLSNEKQVTAKTPPTFLVHTEEDTAVPAENSILFYRAMLKNKVPGELHVFEKGPHGLGMDRRPELPFSSWPRLCQAWLQGRGILTKNAAP